jgi:Leucine-rich repeat (LRR) protein
MTNNNNSICKIVNALPDEVLQRVLSNINISGIVSICQSSDKATKVCIRDKKVWSKKILRISTQRELGSFKKHSNLLRNVGMLDLGDGDLTEADFQYLVSTCQALKAVKITNLAFDFDDQHLQRLVQKHGKTLKCLILDRSYLLTNFCAKLITDYCPKLSHLSLFGCMISDAAIHLLTESENLCRNMKHLDIGRCHLLNFGKMRSDLVNFKNLQHLSLAHNDSCYAQGLLEIIQKLPKLKTIDVSGCIELTRKDIKELSVRADLNIVNTASIDDHSFDSIRSFLVSLTY